MNVLLALTLCVVAAILCAGCSNQQATAPATVPSVAEETPVVQEYTTAPTVATKRFKVVESSADHLFIRVATNGKPTHSKAKEIINAFANDYDRIDICAPEATERGKEWMSYMGGVLIDYRTGKSIPIEP